MKKILKSLLITPALLLVIFIVGCSQEGDSENVSSDEASDSASSSETTELVLSHTAAVDTPIYKTYEMFKDLVEEKSKGELTIKIHPHGQLADDTAGVEMLKSGALDIATSGTNNMSPFSDVFLVFDLPYIFEDQASAHKVLDGEVGEEIKQDVEDELDMKLLFYLDPGSQRDLMNTEREIRVPEDIGNLKFRSAESPIEIATIEALGGVATPIAWGETYSSLEQGVINAQLQQYHWAVTENHQEIIRYVTETGGIHAFHVALMSGQSFDNLTEDQQDIILEAAEEAQKFNFEESPNMVDELKQKMIDEGVEIYSPTEEEMKLWKEQAKTIWDNFRDDIPEGLIERITEQQ